MAKVDIELVKMVLQRNDLDVRTVSQIVEDLNQEAQAQANEEDKPPRVKKEFVIVLSDPEDKLAGAGDIIGWIVQIPEGDSPALVEERLWKSAYAFNQSPKGRRMPVQTIGECCEVVSTRFTKEESIWIKTKEPVLAVRTNNKIPTDEVSFAQM